MSTHHHCGALFDAQNSSTTYRLLLLEINSAVIPASHGACMVFLHE
jgi:hypothetical protein